MSGPLLCRNDTQCWPRFGDIWRYWRHVGDTSATCGAKKQTTRHIIDMTPVRLYSIEIWNVKWGQLVGGELGYSVGGIYSSLTGYSDEESAGYVQLTTLGCLLTPCGFEYWDLGMDLDYKHRLGAQLMPRDEFVANVKRTREENKGVIIQLVAACSSSSSSSSDDCDGVQKQNAREIIDWKKKKV